MQQEILAANPGADVRIFAVWFNILPRDTRGGRPADLLTGPRVTQFWDENHLAGTAFAPLAHWKRGPVWDAYFLYGPQASWPSTPTGFAPPQPASWGRTVFSTRDQLKGDFEKLAQE